MEVVEVASTGLYYRRELYMVVALDAANTFNTAKTNECKAISCGVPQGSMLGPLLWNLMYNDLLQMEIGGNTTKEELAEDIAKEIVLNVNEVNKEEVDMFNAELAAEAAGPRKGSTVNTQ
ncbi:Reverse transcriptase domain [Cinara cedri]|uniref:Reverse transcriptase domain n=1 Tax=Cinara cedri TaxID=506608 RepID=A0A5E4N756_9HEMI|nr:Reverse transcriptase domain [Cinara cedri]